MSRTSILRAAAVGLALLTAGCGASVVPEVHSESDRLAVARRMMDEKRWPSAIELLTAYQRDNAGSANVDVATYLLGVCYLRNHDWPLASTEFERMMRDYPESDSTPSASYRLGEALFSQARPPDFDQEYTNKAIEQWRLYLERYPGHWLNAEAQKQLDLARSRLALKLTETGELYLKLKLPRPARTYFEMVERDYVDTLLLGRALLGQAMCDALLGEVQPAIARLRDIEMRFAGQEVAVRAARERVRLEHKGS